MLSAECQMPTLVGSDTLLDKARDSSNRCSQGPGRAPPDPRGKHDYSPLRRRRGHHGCRDAWRNRDFRKFLAGAFFVSSGILFYLYLADVSVPLLGTGFVETPQISGGRSIVHFILFLLCFYFGFVRKKLGPICPQ